MKEEAIRPRDLAKKGEKYAQESIEFLLKHKNRFDSVACPSCETVNEVIELEKNGFSYLECSSCGMLYMSPRPGTRILSEFYSQSSDYKFFNDYIFPASCEVRREKIFIPRVKKVIEICKKHKIPPGKILEIGAGFGIFCEEMAKTRFFKDVAGTEASESLHKTCLSKGFRIYNGLLEDLKIDEQFNFIAAFEVLEHIYNPFDFLKIIHKLLFPDGMLMLTFPNYNGFDIGMLREDSGSIDHEHQNYFNEKSINILLKRAGFSLIGVETPGMLDVDLVKNAFEKRLIKNSFIKALCQEDREDARGSLQGFLRENKLSSHMLIAAKKVIA